MAADPDYRPNPNRAVYVQGVIDQALIDRLLPQILRLQGESREPITVYIDSEGGNTYHAAVLTRLLESPDLDTDRSCRIITVTASGAASAAADLLCSGGYAYAYEGSMIYFHGVRRSGHEITVTVASTIEESLRRSNEQYAIALADKSIRRVGFRYAWMSKEFAAYRQRDGKANSEDIGCFIGLVFEKLSSGALSVVRRAVHRNQRYEDLVSHVAASTKNSKTFQNPKRPADSEAVVIKSIIDFERRSNKKRINWAFSSGGLKQAANDFFLVQQYLNIYDADHLRRLCDNWGTFLLNELQKTELDGIPEIEKRQERMYEMMKPVLRPLWLFFVALCYELQNEENQLSATDAFWLGLIDEVIGGPPDLFPFRLVVENQNPQP